MTSSAFHARFKEAMKEVTKRIGAEQFHEAGLELLKADKFAIHAGDMLEAERTKDELKVLYGVDWHKVKQSYLKDFTCKPI